MSNEQLLILITSILIPLGSLILIQARATRTELQDIRLELRDRLGRIEGYLDVLREFFVGSGRGTAA